MSSATNFDQRYLPTSLTVTAPGPTTLASMMYGDDNAGNITSIADILDPGYDRSLGYDDLGRLTTANSGAALWGTDPANSYAYDETGNMTTLQLGTSRTASFTYSGTTPLLTQVTENGTPRTVAHDLAGNETGVGSESYTYSPRNLLASGDGLEYLYDGRGLRVGVARGVDVPVTALSPATAEVGGVAFDLTVTGSGFTPAALVRWDGSDLTTTYISSTELRAQVGASEIASADTAAVTVAQGGSTSNPAPFVSYFHDVAPGAFAYAHINQMAYKKVTAGCGGGNYCPGSTVTRAQMAVFLLKAVEGEGYAPPVCTGIFDDVACPGGFAVNWIEEFYNRGITAGCDSNNYCPNNPVTRAQMAVFLLKTNEGTDYRPPPCVGVFDDVPCPGGFAVDWVEELARRGITAGCGGGNFCPNSSVTRAQMAVFITKNWGWAFPTVDPYERRNFVYDQTKRLVAESEWVSTWDRPVAYEHVWFGGDPVAQLGPGPSDTHWLVTDHLGAPFMMCDAAANVVWQVEYEPYGQVWSLRLGSDLHQPLRLPGQEAEQLNIGLNGATERHYNIHRWYRSRWGRYTQSDPMGNLIEQLFRRRHLYVYAENNPLALIDPQGLDVHNNCPKPICIKPEKEPGPVVLQPGETHEGPVDGVSNMDGEIIKITDPYNDSDIEVGPDGVNLPGPDFFNYMLGGGKLDCPPDAGWKPIFECAKGKE